MDNFVIVYIEDILVHSKTVEKYAQNLAAMHKIIGDNKLYANKKKNIFARQDIEYLGHVVMMDGIKLDIKKSRQSKSGRIYQLKKG